MLFPSRKRSATPALPTTASRSSTGTSVRKMRWRSVRDMTHRPPDFGFWISDFGFLQTSGARHSPTVSKSVPLAFAIERAGVDPQNLGGFFHRRRIGQDPADVLGF